MGLNHQQMVHVRWDHNPVITSERFRGQKWLLSFPVDPGGDWFLMLRLISEGLHNYAWLYLQNLNSYKENRILNRLPEMNRGRFISISPQMLFLLKYRAYHLQNVKLQNVKLNYTEWYSVLWICSKSCLYLTDIYRKKMAMFLQWIKTCILLFSFVCFEFKWKQTLQYRIGLRSPVYKGLLCSSFYIFPPTSLRDKRAAVP